MPYYTAQAHIQQEYMVAAVNLAPQQHRQAALEAASR